MRKSVSDNGVGAVLLLLSAIAALAQAWWCIAHGSWIGTFSDSLDFVTIADYFTQSRSGAVDPRLVGHFQSSRPPPLYPLLLSLFGAGSGEVARAVAITQALVLLSLAATGWYLIRATGSVAAGSALLLAVVLAPGRMLVEMNPTTESLFGVIVFAALGLSLAPHHRRLVLLLFALAPMARMIGIAGIAAVAVLPRQSRNTTLTTHIVRSVLLAAVLAVPATLWLLYQSQFPKPESYLGAVGGISASGVAGFPILLWQAYASWLDPARGILSGAVSASLLLLALVGFVLRWRAGHLDARMLLMYFGILVLYPYPEAMPRFAGFAFPIVLLCAWTSLQALARRHVGGPTQAADRTASFVPAALLAAIALAASAPTLTRFFHRALLPVAAELDPFRREQTFLVTERDEDALGALEVSASTWYAVKSLTQYVGPGDCVYSTIPQWVWLYGKVGAELVPPGITDPASALRSLGRCRYVLVTYTSSLVAPGSYLYPLAAIAPISTVEFTTVGTFGAHKQLVVALLKLRAP